MPVLSFQYREDGTHSSDDQEALMSSILPDPSTEFGARVARRLREEQIIWLTTVGADGTPQPNPVWFLWDGDSFLIYNMNDARRIEHLRRNPRVALNFDSDGQGGDIMVIAGEARFGDAEPPADQVPAYTDKYRQAIARLFTTPANFAAQYSVATRITPKSVRGF
jgi:PPOX class probable F420-dependent enzyme